MTFWLWNFFTTTLKTRMYLIVGSEGAQGGGRSIFLTTGRVCLLAAKIAAGRRETAHSLVNIPIKRRLMEGFWNCEKA